MRLNLGCGPGPILEPTYVYVDASRKLLLAKIPVINHVFAHFDKDWAGWDKNVRFKNILKMRMKPNSLQSVYSSHLLEHLYRAQAEELLRKIFTALQNEGVIRIALPDYDQFISNFQLAFLDDPVKANLDFELALLSHPNQKPRHLELIWSLIIGNLHIHRWHPNYAVLHSMLEDIGFQNITRKEFQDSVLEGICNLETRDELTFYIEAVKRV